MKKIIALTLALIMSLSCFSLTIFAEETKTTEHLTEIPEGYIGVYTIEDLYCIRNNMTANYILMNDIDLTEATAEGGDWNYGGRGWNPIGSQDCYSASPFSGIFDGNGYSIKGMNINLSKYYSDFSYNFGLFSYLTGTIKNLKVDGKISVLISSYYSYKNYYTRIGGIVSRASNSAVIENCVSNVTINVDLKLNLSSTKYSIDTYIGGIVGEADNNATIIGCANTADIRTSNGGEFSYSAFCSGISGYGGNISKCYNAGCIDAVNIGSSTSSHNGFSYYGYVLVSGISNHGTVKNCYNIGNINATGNGASKTYISGINYKNSNGGNSNYCYNAGIISVTGTSSYRYAYAVSPDLNNSNKCYFLQNSVGVNTGGATSLTETQMKLKSMYSTWDFDTVWTMEGREDYLYPELRDVPLVLPDDSKTAISGTVTVTGEAKVGSTLTAEITDISPDEATFEYLWKADGEVVGTDSSYTLTQNDVGKKITLTVKGNGDFKGEFSSSAIIGECVHSLGEYTNNNDATCEKNETRYAVCEKCGATVTEEIEGTRLPHTFTNYTYNNDATCTADGTKTAKCDRCDVTDTIIAENTMLEHVFSDIWTIDKEATCTEEGVKSHHCKNCDATKDETVLNKLAHVYVSEITEATCDKDGKIVYTCSCGDTYSKIISATGHKDNDGDGKCDECFEYVEENNGENKPACKCICHETGIQGLLYKIFSYLQRYFKIDLLGKVFKLGRVCDCGEYHY